MTFITISPPVIPGITPTEPTVTISTERLSANANTLLTAADTASGTIQNNNWIGLTPNIDFNIWTNDGSGVLLKYGDGYSFVTATGTLTIPTGDYLMIF